MGLIGIVYCIRYLLIALLCPIKRDWILAKGRFLVKVVNFVLLIPFVITFTFNLIDNDKKYSNNRIQ